MSAWKERRKRRRGDEMAEEGGGRETRWSLPKSISIFAREVSWSSFHIDIPLRNLVRHNGALYQKNMWVDFSPRFWHWTQLHTFTHCTRSPRNHLAILKCMNKWVACHVLVESVTNSLFSPSRLPCFMRTSITLRKMLYYSSHTSSGVYSGRHDLCSSHIHHGSLPHPPCRITCQAPPLYWRLVSAQTCLALQVAPNFCAAGVHG